MSLEGPALTLPQPAADASEGRLTPMMAQYLEIKHANPDCLLFYRMGDFYELFFGDAEVASRVLGIVLTKRGKHLGEDIRMCGVPVERSEDYLHRLIAAGHRVAVCEQQEDPAEAKKRGGKSVVKRGVVRLVTPGTITEETLLEPSRANLLAALSRVRAGEAWLYGLAYVDISTGTFTVGEVAQAGLAAAIARLEPSEILVPDAVIDEPELKALWRETRAHVTPLARDGFDAASGERRLCAFFGVSTLAGFGQFSRAEIAAAAAVVAYVERTQFGARPPLSAPTREAADATLAIDAATRANLELTRTLGGERAGSLLAAIDRTLTPAGGRLLAERLAGPLTDPAAVNERLDAVAWFADDPDARRRVREALKRAPDVTRALSRLTLDRGGPRDLACLRDGLAAARAVGAILQSAALPPREIAEAAALLAGIDGALEAALGDCLDDELPLNRRDGGFVRAGFDPALDEARALRDESRRVIAALQARYAEETGARTLRVKHNNFLGYFVEVTQAVGETLVRPPLNAVFVHRQTMQGAMRFSTAELGDLESRIASAADRALALELAHFDRLRAFAVAGAAGLKAVAAALARIDVAAALAELADAGAWVRPVVDESLAFEIRRGRHPVVEAALKRDGQSFVANDADLSAPASARGGRIALITGPNMAGKSTYLRQNALIAVLAQMGSFVPAEKAHIGVVDRLFSRVGAADDLARGRSTFMVEMIEAAAILNQATARSLVILDEIGRGTATFDGLSIAWAAIEHLHDGNLCRSLFATHFHELTALARRLPRLLNLTVRVTEWQGDVVFLHEVTPGVADRSYGVQVAKLAGLPKSVVERARVILEELEASERQAPVERLVDDLPLFAAARPAGGLAAPPAGGPDALRDALDAISPDELSPREALEALYRLKQARAGEAG
ncbi:DNA mismatch repair protein MutS [Alsobacter sp. SYSU BS001988]